MDPIDVFDRISHVYGSHILTRVRDVASSRINEPIASILDSVLKDEAGLPVGEELRMAEQKANSFVPLEACDYDLEVFSRPVNDVREV